MPTPVQRDYAYPRLPGEGFMRYFVLEPGEGDDGLCGTLYFARLDQAPEFDAISYVWGSSEKTCTVSSCDGQTIAITANLRDALQQIRRHDSQRTVWADSICINQADLNEKAQQVVLMGTLYKKAERVLICLGRDDSGDASRVVSILGEVNARIETELEVGVNEYGELPFLAQDDPLASDPRWKSLEAMINRPWFRRAWVVQEAAFAKDAQVLWGAERIDWNVLLQVDYWLICKTQALVFNLSICHLHFLEYRRRQPRKAAAIRREETMSALRVMADARALRATDNRDRVYAFLEFVKEVTGQVVLLKPDYEISFLDAYRDFARQIMTRYRDIDLLHLVENTDSDLENSFPSWVPRWDRRLIIYNMSSTGRPPLTSRAGLTFDPILLDNDCLRVRGVVLDKLRFVSSDLLAGPKTDPVCNLAKVWNALATILDELPYPRKYAHLAFLQSLNLGIQFPEYVKEQAMYFRRLAAAGARFDGRASRELGDETAGSGGILSERIFRACINRNFIVSDCGYIGLGPGASSPGNWLCIIFGAKSPFVLRRTGDQCSYKLVGEAFISGKKLLQFTNEPEFKAFGLLGDEFNKEWVDSSLEEDIILC
ncbi:HET-domain-containing protein [Thozetella sp. PMI_491]|nr:HET-domain-containing protein [Thozetella sp. PMI_491]